MIFVFKCRVEGHCRLNVIIPNWKTAKQNHRWPNYDFYIVADRTLWSWLWLSDTILVPCNYRKITQKENHENLFIFSFMLLIATFVYTKHTKWSFGNRYVNFTSLHYLIYIKLTAFALIVTSCSSESINVESMVYF